MSKANIKKISNILLIPTQTQYSWTLEKENDSQSLRLAETPEKNFSLIRVVFICESKKNRHVVENVFKNESFAFGLSKVKEIIKKLEEIGYELKVSPEDY